MANTKEDMMSYICRSMAQALKYKWHTAFMQVRFDSDMIKPKFVYSAVEGGEALAFEVENSEDVGQVAKELFEQIKGEEDNSNTLAVRINNDGSFDVVLQNLVADS